MARGHYRVKIKPSPSLLFLLSSFHKLIFSRSLSLPLFLCYGFLFPYADFLCLVLIVLLNIMLVEIIFNVVLHKNIKTLKKKQQQHIHNYVDCRTLVSCCCCCCYFHIMINIKVLYCRIKTSFLILMLAFFSYVSS